MKKHNTLMSMLQARFDGRVGRKPIGAKIASLLITCYYLWLKHLASAVIKSRFRIYLDAKLRDEARLLAICR